MAKPRTLTEKETRERLEADRKREKQRFEEIRSLTDEQLRERAKAQHKRENKKIDAIDQANKEVIREMHKNFVKVIQRGGELEKLSERTEELDESAGTMHQKFKDLKRKQEPCWKQVLCCPCNFFSKNCCPEKKVKSKPESAAKPRKKMRGPVYQSMGR